MRIKATTKDVVNDLNLEHLTIEIEYEDEDCSVRAASQEHQYEH